MENSSSVPSINPSQTPSVKPGQLISIKDLFKKSFEFYKSKLYIISVLALIPFVNFVITSLLMQGIESKKNVEFYFGIGLIFFIFSLFAIIVNFWVELTFFYVIKGMPQEAGKDAKTDVKNLLKFSWPNIYSILAPCGIFLSFSRTYPCIV